MIGTGRREKHCKLIKSTTIRFLLIMFCFDNKYYFDKYLIVGASIIYAVFKNNSTALHWFTEIYSLNEDILHYLEDFNSPTHCHAQNRLTYSETAVIYWIMLSRGGVSVNCDFCRLVQ